MNGQIPGGRGRIAIAGIGESTLGRVPGSTALSLMAQAAGAAVADAGCAWASIDGLLTVPPFTETWSLPCLKIADALGIRPKYAAVVELAGASGVTMIHHAAMAIAAGQCSTVLCVAGDALLTQRGRLPTAHERSGPCEPIFERPLSPSLPSLYALAAQAHMDRYGTTSEQMAEVAVAARAWAGFNAAAHRREPITVADVLASPMLSSPFHVLDCSVVSDGAGAVIVTSTERARDMARSPVVLLGHGLSFGSMHIGDADDLTVSAAKESGRLAYEGAGLSARDISVAELYDCFVIAVIIELEDLGFCAKGEGGPFVTGGRIGPGGCLPTTTHGGLMSCAHPGTGGGFLHLIEGARQIRGDAGPRQVADAHTALIHGNGGVLSAHATMILGSEATL